MYGKSNMETYITICKIEANGNRGSVSTSRGGVGRERVGSFKTEGIYAYL